MKLATFAILLCAIHAAVAQISFTAYASADCSGVSTTASCDATCDWQTGCTGGTCHPVGAAGFAKCDSTSYDGCLYSDAACTTLITPEDEACTNNLCEDYDACVELSGIGVGPSLRFNDCPAPASIENPSVSADDFCSDADTVTGDLSFEVDCFCCGQAHVNGSDCLDNCYEDQSGFVCEVAMPIYLMSDAAGVVDLTNFMVSGVTGATVSYDDTTDILCLTGAGGESTYSVTADFSYSGFTLSDDPTLSFTQGVNITDCDMNNAGQFLEQDNGATEDLTATPCGVCCDGSSCELANAFSTDCSGSQTFDGASTSCSSSSVCTDDDSAAACLNSWL